MSVAGEARDESRAIAVVMAFLACGGRRDFSSAKELLDEAVTRIGPDGDVKSGRDDYLSYLESVLADVRDYHYEVQRCVVSPDNRIVVVEIEEGLTEAGGAELEVKEAMVFDLTAELRIVRLSVYTKV